MYMYMLCMALVLAAGAVRADLSVNVSLSDQMPPLAHAGQDYSWSFLPTTFSNGNKGQSLKYTASGLPNWAKFDGSSRKFSGKPPKNINGEQTSTVTVTAKGDGSSVTDTFRMVTISDPAPTLKKPLRDQLPQMASMGRGNMLPNKILHMPLGWSFSIGFDGDTFVLPEQNQVYYTVKLADAQPLPNWLKYDPKSYTLDGVAPTNPGPNGAHFQVVVYASNKPNTGGPTDNFTIFVGHGVITPQQSPLPAANVTEGDVLQYNISSSDFLLDGKKPPNNQRVKVALGSSPPSWIKYDQESHNLTGTAPFDAKQTEITRFDAPLSLKVSDNQPTELNVTVNVYPSPFTHKHLPNVTLPLDKEFNTPLGKYLRGDNLSAEVTFSSMQRRRAIRYSNSRPIGVVHRRATPDWISYDEKTQSLRGKTPNSEQQLQVKMVAANPIANAPVPASTSSFIVNVHGGGAHNTTDGSNDNNGLSKGAKIAIGVSIGGAFFLALILALIWYFFMHKRSRYETPVEQDTATMPRIEDTQDVPVSVGGVEEHGDVGVNHYADATPMPSPNAGIHEAGGAGIGAAGVGAVGAGAAAAAATADIGRESTSTAGTETSGAGTTRPGTVTTSIPRTSESFTPLRSRITPVTEETYAIDESEPAHWRRVDEDPAPTPFLAPSERMEAQWTEPARGALRERPQPRRSSPQEEPAGNATWQDRTAWPDESAVADPGHSGYGGLTGILGSLAAATGLAGLASRADSSGNGQRTNLITDRKSRESMRGEGDISTEPMVTAEGNTSVDHGLGMQNVFSSSKSNSDRSSSEPDTMPNIMVQRANQAISDDMHGTRDGIDNSSWEDGIWYAGQAPHERSKAGEAPAAANVDSDEGSSAMHTARGTASDDHPGGAVPAPAITSALAAPPEQDVSFAPTQQSFAERSTVSTHPAATSPEVTSPWVYHAPEQGASVPAPAIYETQPTPSAPQGATAQPLFAQDKYGDVADASHVAESHDAGVFDDADDPVNDPFEGHEYPYGTVIGQRQRPESGQISVESPYRRSIEMEYRQTEASIAQFLAGGRADDDDTSSHRMSRGSFANTPHRPLSSTYETAQTTATMESIDMAHSRSVAFDLSRPPRLQLASCRPGENIALPLLNSLASVPQHLRDAVASGENARYVPQLYAPTRSDLHETWPSWIAWLAWDDERQELSGTVPPEFAQQQRLPMQLPIHVLLYRHDPDATVGSQPQSLLVARILLTILHPSAP